MYHNYLSLGEMNSDPSSGSHVNKTFEIFINRSNDSKIMQKIKHNKKKLVVRNRKGIIIVII